ncbi:SDR family oxidoreductase [Agromyces sp. NPDC055520]
MVEAVQADAASPNHGSPSNSSSMNPFASMLMSVGAWSPLGTAKCLLDDGWAVAIAGRDKTRLASAEEALSSPDKVLSLVGDASNDADVRMWVEAAVGRFGGLTAVVASAGFATTGWLEQDNPDAWRQMVLTNVLGPALLIHHAKPELIRTRGRIVLVGSVAGMVPTPGNLYGATKYAITGLAENTRRAFTEDQVGVTLLAPGRVDSPFWDDLGGRPDSIMLAAADLARATAWVLNQPRSVDINTLTIRPFKSAA